MNELEANRWKSGRQFGRSEKRLLDAIVRVETIPIATIKRRFEELKSKWIICQRTHQAYIESLNDTSNENININYEEKWIENITLRRCMAIEKTAGAVLQRLNNKNSIVVGRMDSHPDANASVVGRLDTYSYANAIVVSHMDAHPNENTSVDSNANASVHPKANAYSKANTRV